jgi:hypothetical protein
VCYFIYWGVGHGKHRLLLYFVPDYEKGLLEGDNEPFEVELEDSRKSKEAMKDQQQTATEQTV